MLPGDLPVVEDDAAFEEVQDMLLAAHIGDGLPMVPPTEARVGRMLDGVVDRDRSYGLVPPLFGELTLGVVGYYAAVAGCRPTELPLVLAAARACLAPEFNLMGIQTTTGTAAVAMIVHGSAVTKLGLNAGANCLGPGNRVNACVGRAVSLLLRGVGGAEPGVVDMATTGQPGKYTFCAAESTTGIYRGLAMRRGLVPDLGAVTVIGVGGTAEVLPLAGGGTVEETLAPLAEMLAGSACSAGDPGRMATGEQFFLLPPEVAQNLVKLGASLESIQHYLFDRGNAELRRRMANLPVSGVEGGCAQVARDAADIHPVVAGGIGIKMQYLAPWIGGTRSVTRVVEGI